MSRNRENLKFLCRYTGEFTTLEKCEDCGSRDVCDSFSDMLDDTRDYGKEDDI